MGRPFRHAVVATLAIAGALGGCSSSDNKPQPSSAAPETTTAGSSQTPTAAPGSVAVSPGGVTTAIGAPANSTEDEYFQACFAAKRWMDQQGGDPKAQTEPYLGMLQSTDSAGPGTYNTPWSHLPLPRQAAVIVAAQAAADGLCG